MNTPFYKIHCDIFSSNNPKNDQVCLFLHGFPALPAEGFESCEKGKDIAQKVANELGLDSYVIHYQGLGKSSGPFSFLGSIKDSIAFAKNLITEKSYKKINLIGHSWGGLIAVNIFKELKDSCGKMILLSPFNKIPDQEPLVELLKEISADASIDYLAGSIENAAKEIDLVKQDYNPRLIAKELPFLSDRIYVIQSKDDDEVPVESIREFVNLFNKEVVYTEIDSDHKFLKNRELVIDFVLESLR